MRRPSSLVLLLTLAGCAVGPHPAVGPEAPAERGRVAGGTGVEAAPTHLTVPGSGALAGATAAPGAWQLASLLGKGRASSGFGELACDGDRTTEWNPRQAIVPGKPQWLALALKQPAAGTLALVWHGHGMHYQYGEYGRPRTYEVQVSADSTDGADGTWRTVETVQDNPVRSRAAVLEAPGARWVRMRFLTVWDGRYANEPYVREAAVYEATRPGGADTWLLMGDSVTSVAFDPALPDVFSPEVARRHGEHQAILLSGGTGGDEAADAVTRLRVALPTLPPGSVVGLCYGTNDATRGVSVADYRARLQAAIELIQAHGHQPVLAVVPWSLNGRIAEYAEACRELIVANDLPPGPDFFAYFKANPEELRSDKVHPNDAGVKAMQRLWAESAAFRYGPR